MRITRLEERCVNLFTHMPCDRKEYVHDNISSPSFENRWNMKISMYRRILGKSHRYTFSEALEDMRISHCNALCVITYGVFRSRYGIYSLLKTNSATKEKR